MKGKQSPDHEGPWIPNLQNPHPEADKGFTSISAHGETHTLNRYGAVDLLPSHAGE